MKRTLVTIVTLLLCAPPTALFSRSEFAPAQRSHPFCGTYPGRLERERSRWKDLRLVRASRPQPRSLMSTPGASQDVGQIAVIEDDGTIVSPQNAFDLSGSTLRLSPLGSSGSYMLSQRTETIGSDFGTQLSLGDDDTRQINFSPAFSFPFFGSNYTSVFINSDGNVTFGQGDSASTSRDLSRLNGGRPRIAPFLADLDPTSGLGAVYYNAQPDRFTINWNRVREFEGTTENSFQLVLFSDGAFEMTYGGITAQSEIVGWSGGSNLQQLGLVDLSASAGILLTGPKAERFSNSTEVDLASLSKKFYQTHPDDFDQLVMFTNFGFNLDGAFAFELLLKNQIRGINQPQVDFSADFGSAGRLQSFLTMNQLSQYPTDPDTVFLGTNSTINVMGQEAGHRWLAFVRYRDSNGQNSTRLLGRDNAHWSFFFNSDASVMEGNQIEDRGAGNFRTIAATDRYSKLDQYIMGLLDPSQVGPLFYVDDVSGTSRTPSSAPAIGVSFQGTRRDLTVNDIIAAEGTRVPSAAEAPKVFRQAFILLVQRGTIPSSTEVSKIDRIRQRWQEFFFQATDGLGTADTSLNSIGVVPTLTSVAPISGPTVGNTPIYITGNNFQPGVSVMIGSNPATNVQRVDFSLITATTPSSTQGTVSVAVANPGSQPASLVNAYTYTTLAPANVPQGALRVALAVDTLSFRSNLGINNPGLVTASVRLQQIDANGLLINALDSISVPPGGFVQKNSFLRELEGSSSATGRQSTLSLESTQPIQAFVSQIDNQTGDPRILEGFHSGSPRLILQSAANTGPFRSDLAVVNLSPTGATVDITSLNRDTGQPQGSKIENLAIPANGFVSYQNILAILNVNDAFGPVEIRSTNGANLAAVSSVSGLNAGTSGFFPALSADSGQMSEIIPFVVDTAAFRTNLGLNNLGTQVASVNVVLFGPEGNALAGTSSPITVAPQGMVQINNVLRFLISGSSSAPVTNQQGYLQITSNTPIKAFATQIDNLTNDPSIENSVSSGSPNLLLKSSANLGFRSTLAIVNPNPTPAVVEIQAREGGAANNGTPAGSRTVTIPARGQFLSNNILQDIAATSTFGPIEIRCSTGIPIIAISRVYNTAGNTSGFFNTEPLP